MRDMNPADRSPKNAPATSYTPPEERAWACAECGNLFTSADMLDFCDSCGAPRCRSCAARDGDDTGGVYICSTCAADLDPL